MKIYLGADHRGFELKNQIKDWLQNAGHQIEDCGALTFEKTDDYPDYAKIVGEKVALEPSAKGILICGSGAGMNIAANKITGVRSSIGFNIEQVKAARNDDNLNVLVLACNYIMLDDAQELVLAFLTTSYDPTDNHARRLLKIKNLES